MFLKNREGNATRRRPQVAACLISPRLRCINGIHSILCSIRNDGRNNCLIRCLLEASPEGKLKRLMRYLLRESRSIFMSYEKKKTKMCNYHLDQQVVW